MAAEMSASALRAVCAEHKGYRTPALNDALYCNHKGFARLANLEPYTGLKALYLEGNALRSFDGLPLLADLKCMCVRGRPPACACCAHAPMQRAWHAGLVDSRPTEDQGRCAVPGAWGAYHAPSRLAA